MAHVEDRWMIPGPTGRKVKSPRHGQGSRWLAVWHETDGRRRKKSFRTKDAAEAHLDHVGVSLRSGTYVAPERGAIPLAEMAEHWYRAQVHQRPSSLRAIRARLDNTILPTLGRTALTEIDKSAVQDAVTEWSTRLAPSTVRVAYVYLAGVFALAVEERRILSTPCRKINLPPDGMKLVEPMKLAKVQDLVDALWVPYRPMAALIVGSGVRPSEATGLTGDRLTVVEVGARMRIDRQLVTRNSRLPVWGPPKTDSSYRSINIGPETLAALGDFDDGLVLMTGKGQAITRGMASTAWRAAGAKVGLPVGTGWHDLRHFHASKLIAGGSSPRAVASRLGHKDPTETLRTYAHLWPDDDEKMRDATDGLIVLPPAA